MIDENKIFTLKNKINTLSNVLKKCKFDKARLEAIFFKRQTQRKLMFHMLHMLTHNLIHIMTHTLNMLIFHMLIMHIDIMHFFMPRCIHAPIVAEKVTWPSFVMIT